MSLIGASELLLNHMMKLKTKLLFPVLIVMLLALQCNKESEAKLYAFPLAEAHMIDESELIQAYERADDIDNLRCLLVSKDNVLVAEVYFKENAQHELHDVMSVTKSFTSTLIGIAIDKGFINNLDQTLGDFIDPTVYDLDEEKSAISLYNLLRMSSGIPWEQLGNVSEFIDWYYYSEDHIDYILDKDMTYTPGSKFNYSDGTAHLVSVVLTEATGMTALEFANTCLFNYLDVDSCKWTEDNRGYNFGGVRLKINPITMLKFGELMLNGGINNNEQIVSKTWIENATVSQITTNNLVSFQNGYGLFWWTGQKNGYKYFFANGYGGQFIVVIPDLEMVVIATNNWGGLSDDECGEQWYRTMDVIVNYVITSAI